MTTKTGTVPTIASGDTTTVPTNLAEYRDFLKALSEAWSTHSPTITAETGTFTSVSGSVRYLQANKLVIWAATFTITTAGTAAGALRFTFPVTPHATSTYLGTGVETAATGVVLSARWNGATVSVYKYDNSTIIASGRTLYLQGQCEVA